MKYFLLVLISSFSVLTFSQQTETIITDSTIIYYGRQYFLIEGTTILDSLKESPYDRLSWIMRNV